MVKGNHNIYLDNQSTTPADSRVVAAMLPYFSQHFGNPSSDFLRGLNAKRAISTAREQVANLIQCDTEEIFFTSGATESINWGLKGIMEKAPQGKCHIVTTAIEHSSVLRTCEYLEHSYGFTITYVKPNPKGIVEPESVEKAITPKTLMVVIQQANNEIGTIQPLKEIGLICKKAGVYFMVDAAQSLGKIPCYVNDLNIDLLAASGHKIYAPKGIGFLYIRSSIQRNIKPLLHGGDQEKGFRSGTENVPYIVALGEACRICQEEMKLESQRISHLRGIFIELLKNEFPNMIINGSIEERLPGNINFSIPGISSDLILRNLEEIFISKASACTSNKRAHSHVLRAITNDINRINSAIRIGIGRFNTEKEIHVAASVICKTIEEIKKSIAQF